MDCKLQLIEVGQFACFNQSDLCMQNTWSALQLIVTYNRVYLFLQRGPELTMMIHFKRPVEMFVFFNHLYFSEILWLLLNINLRFHIICLWDSQLVYNLIAFYE